MRYVKTKGGFWKLCDKCRAVLAAADLLEPELIITAQETAPVILSNVSKED